ncbi:MULTISPECIES: DMT family transporter [unclassified Azospirillum]|uniref:DMT family transporter n=1 Tax=unclassified Azospirillum TaxID=2630922 RepID=UPI000B6F5A90|nr:MULTISPECIES: DMT family transporter [unclassified Azospirillum]SNS60159.1 Permease of the drug/metabolite transporter (DMT) superfamily [Azospirillum sp. RU38E]SNS79622.1 Permease of the drug/metabolite transporter (DMT) superfamily [Azospirillum sp. RU37A]
MADESAKAPASPPSRPVTPLVAAILLGLVILLWGVNWPVMKRVVGQMPPMLFVAARLALGTATLIPVAWAAGQLRLPDRRDLPVLLSVGGLQMTGFMTLVTLALQHVPAGRAGILAYTTPLWVVPLALIFLKEKLSPLKVGGLLLGLAGVAVLFNPAAFDWSDPAVLTGNGMLMAGAALWAVNIVQVRGHRWVGTPLSLAPWQMGMATLLTGSFALATEDVARIQWSGELVTLLVYNGPLATAFCFWAMVTVNRALPAITLSLSTLAVPVVGLAASALWLGEAMTITNIAGLGFIAAGLVAVAAADSRR